MIRGKKNIKCGLIGERLSHSFSPQIHSYLADYSYELFEMSEGEVELFLKSDRFDSTNVTIPYKKTVMPFLDEVSEEALRIGSVNTITKTSSGGLRGDNTDYFGFSYMLHKAGITVKNKNVLILGTGGSSMTARTLCEDMGAKKISIVSRTGEINYDNVYDICSDSEIIINTTPVGMYPNNLVSPIDLGRFKHLESVADIIYNPSKTKLLLDAERLGVKYTNGLSMLVAQAKRASELFLCESIDDGEIDKIVSLIENATLNIVLIGMPGCGKSTIASLLAEKTRRNFVDTDTLTEEFEGRSIPDIFARDGEEYFRSLETEAAKKAGKYSSHIIATGGGMVLREENYDPLKQNGVIFFIERNVSQLTRDGRPLSLSADLSEMYKNRLPLYQKFADHTVRNDGSVDDCVNEIIRLFSRSAKHEIIGD